MTEILFASNNTHKVKEVSMLLPSQYHLLGLHDLHWTEDIPEPFDTYEDNAKAKALFVFEKTGLSCFADDSGLAIDAMNGRPGVFSARYAGDKGNAVANIKKVLKEMDDISIRTARFYSIIAYINKEGAFTLFKGTVEGTITYEPIGEGGFGYDPIFIPQGFFQTFGQLPDLLKNKISHRAIAIQKFVNFLNRETYLYQDIKDHSRAK
ncbi:MAG: RdgB/HAM1 family non-canonical purine NTP pyrophosphatase [Bacteroidota bacterium]|nr:RdgB/HAM1 family non-canonical purine NTP pyrophosphatase [Bacteroidota bacterium]